MKRFWAEAAAPEREVLLDGRPVRTPKRNALILPTHALAEAVAAEWNVVGETLDPRAMPLTGLANAAIDIVAADPVAFARGLAAYGETDLLAYRADNPAELVARQAAAWDSLLDWARRRYDVSVELVAGVMHRPQPEATVARLGEAIAARGAFELAGLSPIVTISGSLIVALALAEGEVDAGQAWAAAHLDELWQAEQWGEDELALKARTARRAEWDAAARFLELVRA